MYKDSYKISLMLDFLSKNSRNERIRSLLGRGETLFYLIRCEELDWKSLLQYIVDQGNRMMRQKEELIDLAIKIPNINQEAKLIEEFKQGIAKDDDNTKTQLKSQRVQDHLKKYVEGIINGGNEDEFRGGIKSATGIDLYDSPYSKHLSELRTGLLAVYATDNTEVKDEVIGSFKAGLPPSVGLRDSIDMISERFSWTWGKMVVMILISFLTNIFGVAFYGFDFYSDFEFSRDIITKNDTNCSKKFSDFSDNFKDFNITQMSSFSEFTNFLAEIKPEQDEGTKCENSRSFSEDENQTLGLITMIHCFIPFLFIILVFCRMIFKEKVRNYWSLFSSIPLPIITNFYNIYLAYKCHRARGDKDFKEKVAPIEEKIKKHEKSVVLALVIEAATEASFQFFIQTLYLMPSLVTDTSSIT